MSNKVFRSAVTSAVLAAAALVLTVVPAQASGELLYSQGTRHRTYDGAEWALRQDRDECVNDYHGAVRYSYIKFSGDAYWAYFACQRR
ncbi:hypothetical protein SK571_42945 [Lentzea sp. BCCO 10_0798]|uniref:Uncharacterized protein n=1 Tax=Lentzea kristufekii TaxID=3095430 RepID=A0ABU4U7I9_9PSEU|nr:hypothetical protein [Lentzea sp. BCCO 10_0798]MDX8056174.1 hypothetical protein [Lentzea sp. BCCO 10_0798]